jgi:hypothetical protein
MLRRGPNAEEGCTIAGSVYQAPQRRFAVHGRLLDGRRDDGMKSGWVLYVSTETKGRRRALD